MEENLISNLVSSKPGLIVCLKGISNIGKTGTIIELIRMLLPRSTRAPQWNNPNSPPPLPLNNPPKTLNVEVWVNSNTTGSNIHIGLDTTGDNGNDIRQRVRRLAENGCSLIFCTCRSQGDPYAAVKEIANQYGYNLITTAPYTLEIPHLQTPPRQPQPIHIALHRRGAEHLETFI